jgi:hypothetical protein
VISFRFHIVSITAVFLAIAIGVVVGTTYVDRAVVDSLESRVDRVSRNLDQRKAENDALERDLRDVRSYAGASADFAVDGRLAEVPVLVVALRGVDGGIADAVVDLVRRAGASTPGVAWVEDRFAIDGDEDHDAVAAALGADPKASDRALQEEAVGALVASLSVPPEGVAADASPIERLLDAKLLSVDPRGDSEPSLASFAGLAPRVLLVTGTEVGDDLAELVPTFAEQAAGAGLATVAADAYRFRDEGPDRGETLRRVLPEDLREQVALVDDLEAPEGRVAAVLALVEVAAGRVGHYGYGSGADGALPAWTAP